MRRRWRKPDKHGGKGEPLQPNSLFGEILDWMLAPLLFLWPISIIVTHNVADNLANRPYDLALADSVRALTRLVAVSEQRVSVEFPHLRGHCSVPTRTTPCTTRWRAKDRA